jgi:Fe-Mn family superoxide dismutase
MPVRSPAQGTCGMTFKLDDLTYPYDALAPYMSCETLEYHHDKHHWSYVDAANKLAADTQWEGRSLEEIVVESYGRNAPLFNNAAQHYNHRLFWRWMRPGGGGDKLPGRLHKKITSDLGSLEKMKESFVQAGLGQFGSGWCWLAVKSGHLIVTKTPNGENPLVHGAYPILGCDLWEHAYYIDYRNRRADYLRAFLDHLANWDYADWLLEDALQQTEPAL